MASIACSNKVQALSRRSLPMAKASGGALAPYRGTPYKDEHTGCFVLVFALLALARYPNLLIKNLSLSNFVIFDVRIKDDLPDVEHRGKRLNFR